MKRGRNLLAAAGLLMAILLPTALATADKGGGCGPRFLASDRTVVTPATVSFDGSGSTTCDAAAVASYHWDFGDGSTAEGALVSHEFQQAGNWSVVLTTVSGNGETSTVASSVDVRASNAAPSVTGETYNINPVLLTGNVLANDSDTEGDILVAELVTGPSQASSFNLYASGDFSYSPAAGFYGTDSFTYVVTDFYGGRAEATATITVSPANTRPVARYETVETPEDTAVTVAVLANDEDADGDPLTVSFVDVYDQGGSFTLNADQTVTYVPAANFNGTAYVDYQIDDGRGGIAQTRLTVWVAAVNDAPVAQDDTVTVAEDTSVQVAVLTNDSDVEGALSVISHSAAANGSVTRSGSVLTYTPNANFHGTDSFTYTVRDSGGQTATASVAVTVTSVYDAPVAVNDSASTNEDAGVSGNVLANDSVVEAGPLAVVGNTPAANGSVTVGANGSFTYTPNANFYGTDSFTYTARDQAGTEITASVTIQVASVNDAPVNVDFAATTTPRSRTASFSASAVDLDGTIVSYAWNFGDGTSGSGNAPSHTYASYGSYVVTLTVTDNQGATATVSKTVTVSRK